GVAGMPGRGDRGARREDVDAVAVVGERRPGVGAGGRTHRNRRGRARGRDVAGILAFIARGHDHGDAGIAHAGDRLVGGGRGAATKAHVRHRRLGVVAGDPVHAGDHAGIRARAIAVQYPHRVQPHLLGRTPGGSTDGAGHVGTMAVAVVAATAVADRAVAAADAAAEVAVGGADAGVDHIRMHVGSTGVVDIGPVERPVALV